MADIEFPRPPIDLDDVTEALQRGQFTVAYQPQVAITGDRLSGVEALARWNHPRWGLIAPAVFMSLIEEDELIHPFTDWLVSAVTADWAKWRAQGLVTSVAVNVSARNLSRIDFPDLVVAHCRNHDMPRERLIIELTETSTEDLIFLLDTLSRFRIKDIGVSLDDYGTGHSSLTRFEKLPFSEVKIDRSLVTDVDSHTEKQEAIRAIVDMTRNFGIHVIAEGVETAAALRSVAQLGCDAAQGYFFAKPMSAEHLPDWTVARFPSH